MDCVPRMVRCGAVACGLVSETFKVMASTRTQNLWSVVLVMYCLASVAVGGRMIAQEEGRGISTACKPPTVKTAAFLSPPIKARPGDVNEKYFAAEFPEGHIGIKTIRAEIVDENEVSVPLSDVYLHHWLMYEYAVPRENCHTHLQHLLSHMSKHHNLPGMHFSSAQARLHQNDQLHATLKPLTVMGSGEESRKTDYRLPGPYVRESGKEKEGYVSVWSLNVHALDTRGAVNRMGCAECWCHLYNRTTDPEGNPLPEGFLGGTRCCADGMRCAVEEGFDGEERTFYFKYTYEYVDWNDCLIPVTAVGTDITDPDGFSKSLLEYTVEGCGDADPNSEECIDTRVATFISPFGGDVVHTGCHLHIAAMNASLWGEDGRLICEATPMYGQGHEAGNEKGYVVGIKTCLGNAGTANAIKVKQGEKLKFIVHYTKVGGPHTGVMGTVEFQLASDGVLAAY